MIITNLAARGYASELDVWSALRNIVEEMPHYVNVRRPRVPNPADPAEDYADKWAVDSTLEDNFWSWHTQVKIDVNRLPTLLMAKTIASDVQRIFRVDLTQDQLQQLRPRERLSVPAIVGSPAALQIRTPPRPWSDHS